MRIFLALTAAVCAGVLVGGAMTGLDGALAGFAVLAALGTLVPND